MRWLELRIPPVLAGLASGAAMYGFARIAPTLSYAIPHAWISAIILAAAGTLLSAAGVVALRREGTTVDPLNPSASSSMVTGGAYRVSRNPMYLGLFLTLAGWGVYLSNAASLLGLPLFVLYMNRFQIEPEERALREKFGPPFERYMSRVRRWI